MKFILVYIASPTGAEARKIAKHLLKKKLIACGNIYRVNSFYVWKRKLVDAAEHVLIGKTVEKNFKEIKEEVGRIHSYETPCILKIPAEANERFFSWVKDELK